MASERTRVRPQSTLRGMIVVLAGASSGIGRATALAFAREGASLVLAARRRAALEDVARECRRAGGNCIAVPTDITDAAQVERLAAAAVAELGRIDVWVNDATAAMYGRFEDSPRQAFERVVEVNLFGYANGMRSALKRFRSQGSGILINVASVAGKAAFPYMSAYVAAKFGVVGLSETLREELIGTGIHVCTILPGPVDTPFYEQAANYTGRRVQPMLPTYSAEDVARAIVRNARRPTPETYVGRLMAAVPLLRAAAPPLFRRSIVGLFERIQFADEKAPHTSGNLWQSSPYRRPASGGWEKRRMQTRAGFALAIGAGMAAALAVVWRNAPGRTPAQTGNEPASVRARAG